VKRGSILIFDTHTFLVKINTQHHMHLWVFWDLKQQH